MVDERLTAGGQIVADNEVQSLQADVDGTVEPALTVDQDMGGVADPVFVVGPQREIGGSRHGDACDQLSLAQFLAEAGLSSSVPKLRRGLRGVGETSLSRSRTSSSTGTSPWGTALARPRALRLRRVPLKEEPVHNRSATLIR
ncbi:hypothetical protein [Streptomyces sp. NPDC006355]|uniref:hypothetical protein n=1 Tax=Streptomyces sp. NPDC006355 TaxID=3156758 RepID=UPI0033A5A0D5